MIDPKLFYDMIQSKGSDFYVGVPDSLLANFCSFLDTKGKEHHLIAANEGNAIAIAMGYYMSTKKVAAVYMQNSGLGNSINPLVSLTDPLVYKIPMLLIIGWRGEPGYKDEPQHQKQGGITIKQLEILDIPYWILDEKTDLENIIDEVFLKIENRGAPVAIIVRKNTFKKTIEQSYPKYHSHILREEVIDVILKLTNENDLIIATTGKTSREIFEIRKQANIEQRDFLTVGGMGHASSIALGVSIGMPDRRVICFDGDGSIIMHMGSMPVISKYKPKKFIHILLNNGTHESVGGQPTCADIISFRNFAHSIGYLNYVLVDTLENLESAWSLINKNPQGPVMLEIKIKNGSRDDLGRPTNTAEENKNLFMKNII